ncbi:hypothetical protein [Haloarcula salinisoli]|uniref:Uncharacterized protein n=1 Tax=Haloarcula salinisoli TaxID=2487746 RepID=A0A8J7YKZ8_9EURY|nr:hypothetical protein [Halomicroarcula salinisoli]MBX0305658.1 hypothetical protein [Halomicroarcula salinisoli]
MEPTRLEKRYTLDTAAVNRTEASQINDSLGTFYERLAKNRSQRRNRTAALASDICSRADPIDPAAIESTAIPAARDDHLGQAAERLETNGIDQIDADRVRSRIQQGEAPDEYAPLVATYNQYHAAACNLDIDRQATVDRFYRATSALGIELLFVQSGATYTVTASVPRDDVQARAIEALDRRFGDAAVQVVMTESHWASRGDLRNLTDYLREQYRTAELRYDGDIDRAMLRARIAAVDAETTLDDAQVPTGADRETLGALLERANESEQVNCVLNQRADWDDVATQLVEISADGEVTAAELETLPDEPRKDVVECLQAD